MGFQEDVETIMKSVPKEGRITNLWSATVPKWVQDLALKYCRKVRGTPRCTLHAMDEATLEWYGCIDDIKDKQSRYGHLMIMNEITKN